MRSKMDSLRVLNEDADEEIKAIYTSVVDDALKMTSEIGINKKSRKE
jgi:hypothetical protein